MTNTAWISAAVIVAAICILVAVLATMWMKNFRLSFPVPFLQGEFVLSPHDSKRVNQENLLRLELELFNKFVEVTKRGEEIDRDAMRRTNPDILKVLVSFNLLHSDSRNIDPDAIKLGYLGWQALQNWLRDNKLGGNPKIEPWSWLKDSPRRN